MGGSTSTTQQQYPSFVEGFGKDFFKDANKAFNKGPQYYKGSTVTPMSTQTTGALGYAKDENGKLQATGGGLMGLADANANGNGMSGALQSILSNGGFNQGQMGAMGSVGQLANNGTMNSIINGNGLSGDQNQAFDSLKNTVYGNNQQFQQTFNQGGFDSRQAAAYGGLNDTVNRNNSMLDSTLAGGGLTGDQRGAMNRYTQQATTPFEYNQDFIKNRQNALDTQSDALAGRAAAAGRYGGGMDQAILAREQGNLASRMNQEQLAQDQNQKNIANAALMSGGQQAVGNQLGVNQAQQQGYQNLGTFGQIGQGNQLAINSAQQQGLNNVVNTGALGVNQNANAIAQKAGLENSLFNMNQAGLSNMGQAYQTAQQPYQTQAQVGQQFENLYTQNMQDKLRKFDASNPYNHLQQYGSLLSGAPMNTVQTSTPSTLQMLLGGGLGTAGLLGSMGMFGGAPAAGGGVI